MQASDIFITTNGFQSSGATGLGSRSSGDFEVALDPATSMIFSSDTHKNNDLKKLLDGSKDNLKLAAMRRIIAMVARGKDCSDLFPAVVKNVASKDPEVKKLVYVYLTRYAEEQEDLALLSISTFQRSLKDSNQLIRASALRVLSSNRIAVIVPILMSAIREGVVDLSPYVRKTVAHAIPKLYSLDPSQKDSLVEFISKLLEDKATLVAGSAVQAFEEVCPERFDLIHKHFRKLCSLIMDVDEWGQVTIINMLTRYARTQFPDPKACLDELTKRPLQRNLPAASVQTVVVQGAATWLHDDSKTESCSDDSEEDDGDSSEGGEERGVSTKTGSLSVAEVNMLRADYRMLITACRLLLLSHNSAVVVAVAQLFYHCAPKDEMPAAVRALIRVMRSSKEVQYVVLSTIASMSLRHPQLFEPHMRIFFVFNNDPTKVKLLKLEILANLVTESSSALILRELQAYVNSTDEEFVLAAVQCIGRCASLVPQIADTCLTGLLRLMSSRKTKESLVAESVVVIRKLLQMQTSDHKELIVHMARMVDEVAIPSARASILWLLGEYGHRVPKTAPDVLRKMAKSFPTSEDVSVKLQILNLAAKLCIINPRQTTVQLLAQYVFTLAKYDQNYDIRDRSRFLRALIFPPKAAAAAATTNRLCFFPKLTFKSLRSNLRQIESRMHRLPVLLLLSIWLKAKRSSKGSSESLVTSYLARNAKKILLATKPAPVLRSSFADRPTFQLGSMSHLLGRQLPGYKDLPEWPLVPPDPTTRHAGLPSAAPGVSASSDKSLSISQLETETESTTETEEEEDIEDDDENGSRRVAAGQEDEEDSNDDNDEKGEAESDDDYAESLATESDDESQVETPEGDPTAAASSTGPNHENPKAASFDLLLDLESASAHALSQTTAVLVPTALATPTTVVQPNTTTTDFLPPGEHKIEMSVAPYEVSAAKAKWFAVTPAYGDPLVVEARFTRIVNAAVSAPDSGRAVNVELRFTNRSLQKKTLHRIRCSSSTATVVQPFLDIPSLEIGTQTTTFVGLNFKDSTQPLRLEIHYKLTSPDDNGEGGEVEVRQREEQGYTTALIGAPVGELLSPLPMTQQAFENRCRQLRGLHETSRPLPATSKSIKAVATSLLCLANLALVGVSSKLQQGEIIHILRFSGVSVHSQDDCLVEVTLPGAISVRTEAISLGLQLANAIVEGLA